MIPADGTLQFYLSDVHRRGIREKCCYNTTVPEERIAALEKKIDAIYVSVEKTRKYIFWTVVVTIVIVVLPAIGLVFAIPKFVSTYTETLNGFDLQGL